MSIAAIIAEYNPFHTGHKYQIEKVREVTGADHVVIIMSGNYVQRGIPAITNKYVRAKAALSCGADMVIELPVFYSTASAEYFAMGAVNLVEQLSCVDYLCFGCESDNIELMSKIADILIDEPVEFKDELRVLLSQGLSYVQARERALLKCMDGAGDDSIRELTGSSNAILGIEYIKALKRFNSSVKPVIIKREGEYNSIDMSRTFASATGIRNSISNNSKDYVRHIPDECGEMLSYISSYPVYSDDFYMCLASNVLMNPDSLSDYFDVSEHLANSINNQLQDCNSFDELALSISGKHTTVTHCNRALIHIILGITKEDINNCISMNYNSYIRLLGFKKESAVILKHIKANSSLPIISKMSDTERILPAQTLDMLRRNIQCDNLYRFVFNQKYNNLMATNEYNTPITIL